MATSPSLLFQIKPEYYATLTLESLLLTTAVQTNVLLQPPFRQPVLDIIQGPQIQTVQQLAAATADAKINKTWLHWFWDVYRWITAAPAPSSYLEIVAPSIDETDISWFGNGTINSSSDPVSFTATLTGGSRFGLNLQITNPGSGYTSAPTVTIKDSLGNTNGAAATATISGGAVDSLTVTNNGYNLVPPLTVTFSGGGGMNAAATAQLGRQWAVGDYIVWNDPTISSSQYQYEIDKITNIVYSSPTSATFTLARRANGAASGIAQFGSRMTSHVTQNFYRLINKGWQIPLDTSLGPQLLKLFWDNMTVAAVVVGQTGQPPITVNLAPPPYLPGTSTPNPRLTPPSPGMRTMNGAAYCSLGLPGTLITGATSVLRVSAQAWESIRTCYAKVITAPVGATSFNGDANAAIVIYVCYISPSGTVGLLDTLVIDTGEFTSYSASNPPDGRQMPYHPLWTRTAPLYDWPPNYLPQCPGALTAGGLLQLPITPSGTASVQFAPDGMIDFIVAQVGTSVPGSILSVTVQT